MKIISTIKFLRQITTDVVTLLPSDFIKHVNRPRKIMYVKFTCRVAIFTNINKLKHLLYRAGDDVKSAGGGVLKSIRG